jgi:hypothetical protein
MTMRGESNAWKTDDFIWRPGGCELNAEQTLDVGDLW